MESAMDFASLLSKISTAAQIAQAAAPQVAAFGSDHVTATQNLLQIAGAGVAAETNDKNIQGEALAAASLASSLTPLVFQLWGLFGHKKAPVVPITPVPNPTA